MSKSSDLMNIQEVCQYYGLSEQTIRRRIRESKLGCSSFPRPITGYSRKALWRRTDIEDWTETGPQEPEQVR